MGCPEKAFELSFCIFVFVFVFGFVFEFLSAGLVVWVALREPLNGLMWVWVWMWVALRGPLNCLMRPTLKWDQQKIETN